MRNLFHKTDALVAKVDEFLDIIDESTLVFKRGIEKYLLGGQKEFQYSINKIDELEESADSLRRQIRSELYQHSLIPEFRADIVNLLEKLDDVVDTAKENMSMLDIEQPVIPTQIHSDLNSLAEVSSKAADALVMAARAFFRKVSLVNDRLHRVYFYEKEADEISAKIKRYIFQEMNDLQLSQKQQSRYIVNQIDNLANISEDAADLLTILAIKRMV